MSDYLEMKKVSTGWVPKLFTPLQRVNRVYCCEKLLENCNQNPTGLFGRLVTGDETWIHYYDLLSQQEAKTWRKPGAKAPTRPRVTRSASKIIMTIWHCEGVLLGDFLPCGTTINGPYYASLLHRLCSSIREKCRGKFRLGVLLLLRQCTCLQVQHHTVAIQYSDFTELNRLAYCPDLAPAIIIYSQM